MCARTPTSYITATPGTSSIVHEITHQPLLSTLSGVVETVVDLKRHGHKVVLVSSGAIGVGLKRMNLLKKPENLSGKQVRCARFGKKTSLTRDTGVGCDWTRSVDSVVG